MKNNNVISNIGDMKEKKAILSFTKYLKEHHITFEPCAEYDEVPCILMLFKDCFFCPDEITEGSLCFYPDGFEARVYYSESGSKWCRESDNRAELYRLLNYINCEVWPESVDGMSGKLYDSVRLFSPRFYVAEDDSYDIMATLFVPYSHFEMDELYTEDFITASLPDLLNDLSRSIFFLLLGEISIEEAIQGVESSIYNH